MRRQAARRSTIPTATGRSTRDHRRPASTTSPPPRRCRSSPAPPMSLTWAITILPGGPSSMTRAAASSPGSKPTRPLAVSKNCRCPQAAPSSRTASAICRSARAAGARNPLPRRRARGSRHARHRQGAAHPVQRSRATAQEIAELYKAAGPSSCSSAGSSRPSRSRRFLGTSENAVRIQIAVALIAFLLLRLAQATQTHHRQPARLRPTDPCQPDAPQTPSIALLDPATSTQPRSTGFQWTPS